MSVGGSIRQIKSAAGSKEAVCSFDFARINSNATTVIKDTPGMLHLITINKAGSSWTITVYNNTQATGSILAVIDGGAVGSFAYNIFASIGLTVVTSGTTAGDMTVVYL